MAAWRQLTDSVQLLHRTVQLLLLASPMLRFRVVLGMLLRTMELEDLRGLSGVHWTLGARKRRSFLYVKRTAATETDPHTH